MRKKIFSYFVLMFVTTVLLQAQNNYEVDFYIHEDENDTIYVTSFCGAKTEISDTLIKRKDNSFHFSAKDYPMGMYMLKDAKERDMFSFLLGKSNKFSIEIYPTGKAFVKNCMENDAYMLYQYENRKYQEAMYYYKLNVQKDPDKRDSLFAALQPIMDTFENFQQHFFLTYPNNFITVAYKGMNQSVPAYFIENGQVKPDKREEYIYYMRKHYWDNFAFNDNRLLYSPYFISQFNNYVTQMTEAIPDSVCVAIDDFIQISDKKGGKEYSDYVIAWYLTNMPSMPFSYNEIIYVYMVNKYINRASEYLYPSQIEKHKMYAERVSLFLPGKIMPNIVLKDFNGKEQSLYSIKNKYTVLYFFSTTCESCKKNLDVLKDLYKLNKEYYDFEIYSIDLEEDYAIAKARQQADPYPWIVTQTSVETLRPYGFVLDHTPEMYVLDKNKRIINKTPMYEQIEKTLDAALGLEKKEKQ
ncbi:MAG: redoxin domain-containing protein [Bacteroidales bacterium]|nr:redoxin domain-containing protein [Bacteroidales bacterium]